MIGAISLGNDYYNPNFEIPLSIVSKNVDVSTIDNSKHDFLFNYSSRNISTRIIDGNSCVGHGFANVNLNHVNPYFSRIFLQNRGYDDGGLMRVDMWIKVIDVDETNARRLCFGIDNSDWF